MTSTARSINCTFDATNCAAQAACGDGVINQTSEFCDGADLGDRTCRSFGLGEGAVTCSPSCTFDTSGCTPAPPPKPDLVVKSVDSSGVVGDWQALELSGSVTVTIANWGAAAVGEFTIMFFEDTNANATYDAGIDRVLGTAIQNGLGAVSTTTVSSPVSGKASFRDNLIYAFVDSDQDIVEADEANNISHTGFSCAYRPPPTQLNPQIEWVKKDFSVLPDANRATITPAVSDLNGDGIPDIVFTTTPQTSEPRVLRAVSGAGGNELWSVLPPAPFLLHPHTGFAIGDIDLDGQPEIVTFTLGFSPTSSGSISTPHLLAFEHDGSFKWHSPPMSRAIGTSGVPSLVDLDQDGVPDYLRSGCL